MGMVGETTAPAGVLTDYAVLGHGDYGGKEDGKGYDGATGG